MKPTTANPGGPERTGGTRLRVGQLAKRTGLTVRTLHHWDEVGLLVPSHRSGSGHRLYDERDLLRLQQVLSLRQLGFALDEIRDLLDERRVSPLAVVETHLARLREQLQAQHELLARLEQVAAGLRAAGTVSADELLLTVEAIRMVEKHLTPEQLEQIRARGEMLGEARIREVEAEWPRLIAAVRAEMDKGSDPSGETVQALARRWQALVQEFTGGDPGIAQGVAKVWKSEPGLAEQHGMGALDASMFEFIGRAMAAVKKGG
jgi:DNA-binding transcriptional MerR regulator